MIGFFLILAGIAGGDVAWWRWADNRVRRVRGATLWRLLIGAFAATQLVYILYFVVAARLLKWLPTWPIPMPIAAGSFLWSLLVLPLSLIAAGAGRVAGAFTRRPTADVGPSRRRVLSALATAVPPLVTAGAVARAIPQMSQFRVRRVTLAVAGLPADLDGLTIAHVSDLHVGHFTRPGYCEKVADATNALRADLVLFTGDLIDFSLTDLPAGIDFLRRLDPRHGLAVIEGNHDLIENPDTFDAAIVKAGFPLLLDSATTVRVRGRPVQLLGTRWGADTGDRRRAKPVDFAASVARLVPQRQPDAFPILMAHHPHAFDPAAAARFPLVLSGHTHGGQIMLTDHVGGGPALYRYWSGRYAKPGSQMVVSNGVGNWFPLRINAPAEVIHLTLRPAATA